MTRSFKNFPVYLKSLDLVEKVFSFLKDKSLEREFEFNNQIKRASLSVSNNIAEGSEYNNNRQFIKYLKISILRHLGTFYDNPSKFQLKWIEGQGITNQWKL